MQSLGMGLISLQEYRACFSTNNQKCAVVLHASYTEVIEHYLPDYKVSEA